jgi:hypothetical protein
VQSLAPIRGRRRILWPHDPPFVRRTSRPKTVSATSLSRRSIEPWAGQSYRVEHGKVHAALPAERRRRFPRLVTTAKPRHGVDPKAACPRLGQGLPIRHPRSHGNGLAAYSNGPALGRFGEWRCGQNQAFSPGAYARAPAERRLVTDRSGTGLTRTCLGSHRAKPRRIFTNYPSQPASRIVRALLS